MVSSPPSDYKLKYKSCIHFGEVQACYSQKKYLNGLDNKVFLYCFSMGLIFHIQLFCCRLSSGTASLQKADSDFFLALWSMVHAFISPAELFWSAKMISLLLIFTLERFTTLHYLWISCNELHWKITLPISSFPYRCANVQDILNSLFTLLHNIL